MELHGKLNVLLEAEYDGKAEGFVEEDWPQENWPVLYPSKQVEKGEVSISNLRTLSRPL